MSTKERSGKRGDQETQIKYIDFRWSVKEDNKVGRHRRHHLMHSCSHVGSHVMPPPYMLCYLVITPVTYHIW